MDAISTARTIRQLQRAEGYIELQLGERAIQELNSIENPAAFDGAIALLRGEALLSQAHFSDAAESLKHAASTIPAPLNKRAWRSLSACYRQSGRDELAELADLVANTDGPAVEAEKVVRIAIVPLRMLSEMIERLLAGLSENANNGEDDPQA